MLRRFAALLTVVLLSVGIALLVAPTGASGQEAQAEKKKPRKVWTNDDFLERPQAIAKEPQEKQEKQEAKPTSASPSSSTSSELESARTERRQLGGYLERAQQVLDERREEWRRTDDALRLEALSEAIKAQEKEIAGLEAQIQEVDAQIAFMEKEAKEAKGRKRRAPRRARPAATPPPS